MKTSFLLTTLFSIAVFAAFGQSKKEQALEKGRQAIELMDKGQYDESIELLKECTKLHPGTHLYVYEIAYAYQLKGEVKKGLPYAKKSIEADDATDQCYQMYGNLLDMSGEPEEAIEMYDAGLKRFPKSGFLHLEKANVLMGMEQYNEALALYEEGVELDPDFPSNYYHAGRIFLNYTEEEVWGMIYSELFMNLEPASKRTPEISEMLYKTYQSEIKPIKNGDSGSVSFSKSNTISVLDPENFKLPFAMMAYEPLLLICMVGQDTINLESLNTIRTEFTKKYFEMKHDETYPNILFERQKEILDAGHMEAYNYWLLSVGAPDEFNAWYDTHKEQFTAFAEWFGEHPLKLDEKHRFYRTQY